MMGGQVVLLVLLLGIAGAIMEEIKEKMDTITNTGIQWHTQNYNDKDRWNHIHTEIQQQGEHTYDALRANLK